ncbi:type II toxin-antitoxin system VapC family toxin [Microbacterium sp.]|uniref:type II toxin-antitoxin system VapC family toxin n=1 Tax=Microbacterium sp. TaxID=51671 RepID=UPI003A84CFCC
MIVLDASVLIALLDRSDTHHGAAHEFTRAHLGSSLAASALTLAEALVRPVRAGHGADTRAAFASMGVTCLAVDDSDVLELATLRDATRLRMPDAVVLRAAERYVGEVATADAALADAAVARGVTVHRLG